MTGKHVLIGVGIAVSLAILTSGAAKSAADKYTLKVPDGLAFAEFRGYEAWQTIAVSQNGGLFAVILGNPVMINAYQAGSADHIAGIVARGDALTIRLRAPNPDIVSRLTEPPACAVPSDTPIDPRGVNVIPSAGPYYVQSFTPGQGVVLVRNTNYHGSRPRQFERIEVAIGMSTGRAVTAVRHPERLRHSPDRSRSGDRQYRRCRRSHLRRTRPPEIHRAISTTTHSPPESQWG